VIYLDSSVALAHLLSEDRHPDDALWQRPLVSSRLLEFEVWKRINAYGLAESHGPLVQDLVERVGIVELNRETTARICAPFPSPLRTLDALHLSAALYLDGMGFSVEIATYDEQMRAGAVSLELQLHALD